MYLARCGKKLMHNYRLPKIQSTSENYWHQNAKIKRCQNFKFWFRNQNPDFENDFRNPKFEIESTSKFNKFRFRDVEKSIFG